MAGARSRPPLRQRSRSSALPLVAFDNLLQARIFDLYDDPMPTLNDLEGYAGDTESALMQLGAMILAGGKDPGTAELVGHAGVALIALTRLMRALPSDTRRAGQSYLPADLLGEARRRPRAHVGGTGLDRCRLATSSPTSARSHGSGSAERAGCRSGMDPRCSRPSCRLRWSTRISTAWSGRASIRSAPLPTCRRSGAAVDPVAGRAAAG